MTDHPGAKCPRCLQRATHTHCSSPTCDLIACHTCAIAWHMKGLGPIEWRPQSKAA